MENKKGFVGIIIGFIITVAVLIVAYYFYQKISADNLEKATLKAAEEAGFEINSSAKGQVGAVRDMMEEVQEKKKADMDREMK